MLLFLRVVWIFALSWNQGSALAGILFLREFAHKRSFVSATDSGLPRPFVVVDRQTLRTFLQGDDVVETFEKGSLGISSACSRRMTKCAGGDDIDPLLEDKRVEMALTPGSGPALSSDAGIAAPLSHPESWATLAS